MKKIIVRFLVLIALSSTANAQQKLMHYWHFNDFVGLSAATLPSSIAPYRADYSTKDTSLVQVKFDAIPGTSVSYNTYWDKSTGDTVNLRNGAAAGNCLRLRNPSDSMQLQFFIPSTNYKNITIKYEVQKSSATNGAANNIYAYSIDSGLTWKTTGLSIANYTVVNYSGGTPGWPLAPINIQISDSLADNNAKLVFRITFAGSGSTGTSGNNRIDNVSIEGDSIIYPTIVYSSAFAPFIASKNDSSLAQNFTVYAEGLIDTLHVKAPNSFKISLTETGTYNSTLFLLPQSGIVASTAIYVKFFPADTGSFSEEISIQSLDASYRGVSVSGTTLPVPTIQIAGLPFSAFANTQPSQFSAFKKLTINAVNLNDTLWLNVNLPFRISMDTLPSNAQTSLNFVSPSIVDRDIYVFFNPNSFGTYFDTMSVTSLGANSYYIPLQGVSIANPTFETSKDSLSTFSQIVVGSASAPDFFLVDGKHLTGPISITVAAPFKISTTTSNYLNAITLNPSSDSVYQKIYVTFNPSELGEANDAIVISSLDFTTKRVTVRGTTFDPFAGLTTIYKQDFTTASNANAPEGWKISDTSLWSFVSSNASSNYAYSSGGTCLKFDNEGSELPKTAYSTLSGKINTSNYKDIKITWAARRTNNFFNGAIEGKSFFMYSVDGVNWDSVYYITEPNNSNLWAYVNNAVLISLPASCNRKKDVQIRWQFTGEGLGSSGTYRMDDVRVFGTTDTSAVGSTFELDAKINGLSIYPNPVTNEDLHIEATDELSEIVIYNKLGEVVYNNLLTTPSKSIIIPTNQLSGFYFVQVKSAKGLVKTSKVLIMN